MKPPSGNGISKGLAIYAGCRSETLHKRHLYRQKGKRIRFPLLYSQNDARDNAIERIQNETTGSIPSERG